MMNSLTLFCQIPCARIGTLFESKILGASNKDTGTSEFRSSLLCHSLTTHQELCVTNSFRIEIFMNFSNCLCAFGSESAEATYLNLAMFDLGANNTIVKKLRDSLVEECAGSKAIETYELKNNYSI